MNPLTLEEFGDTIHKIVAAGATPVVLCQCGFGSWMYEGKIEYAYKTYEGECRRCKERGKKRLYGDWHAPEL